MTEFDEDRLAEAYERALRLEVSFADEVRAIAGCGKFAGEGMSKVIGNRPLTAAHAQHTGVPLMLAGPKRGPGGQARRNGRIGTAKASTQSGQVIEIGRFQHRMTIGAQTIAAHLVRDDEDEIGH